MPTITPDSNSADISIIVGADAGGHQLPLSSLTATLDDTTFAYITPNPASPQNSILLWKRDNFPAGTTKTVTITFNAKSQDGTPLPAKEFPVDLVSAAVPQATQILVGAFSTHNMAAATDPGSPTVVLI